MLVQTPREKKKNWLGTDVLPFLDKSTNERTTAEYLDTWITAATYLIANTQNRKCRYIKSCVPKVKLRLTTERR